MDIDITLDRGQSARGVSLSPEETALLNEVTIEPEAPIRRNPIKRAKRQRKQIRQEEEYEDEDDGDIGAFMNPIKSSAEAPPPPEMVNHHQMEDEESDDGSDIGGGGMPGGGGYGEPPSKGYTSIDDEKADLLNKLTRLEKKGYNVNKKLNAYSPIQDLRTEVKRITYSIEVEQSVKFSRRTMVACATGLEFLNKRYNPLEIQLDGWSESIMENLDDYDGVFEELHNKYKGQMEVAPEVKLLMMMGGSAMMFHLTNSMFKAAVPNMNDILKQNPGLAQSMVDAVKNSRPKEPPPPAPSSTPAGDGGGRREMQGPGLDLSSLMGGFGMGPPPPMTSRPEPVEINEQSNDDDAQSVSDIVSVTDSEIRQVNTGDGAKKRRGRPPGSKSKKELSL